MLKRCVKKYKGIRISVTLKQNGRMGIGREKEKGRVAILKGARPLLRSLDFEETEELCKSFRQKGDLVKFAFY